MRFHQRQMGPLVLKLFASFYILIFSCQALYASPKMQESVYCKYSDDIVDPYCSYIKKTYQLHCYGNGGGFIKNINNIDLTFNGIKNLSIDETRILIIECTEELLKRFNEDAKVRPYLSHYPFTEQGISLIISFDKKNGDRVDPDFIALAFTCNGMIYYKIYDPKERLLKKVYEEPYQKALQIANQTKFLKKPTTMTQKEESTQKKSSSKLEIVFHYIKEKLGL